MKKRSTGLFKQVFFGWQQYNGLQIILYWLEKYFDSHYYQMFSSQVYTGKLSALGDKDKRKVNVALLDRSWECGRDTGWDDTL